MAIHPTGGVAGTGSGLHRAVRAVVLDALTRGVGETLATNGEFRESLGVGAGTVQRALDLLAERDALHTTARGHLGRRIDRIGIGHCWQAAGLNPVRFILSPAGPVELDALEAALADELTELGVPHTIHHERGGNGRLQAVSDGRYDIGVVSAGTLHGAQENLGLAGIGATRVLPPGTYYAPERLVVLRGPAADDPLGRNRVGIDTESFDHEALTRAEFPESGGFEYVEMHFTEVPARVLAGLVGAGVWHITTSAVPLFLTGLSVEQLTLPGAVRVRDALSAAAAVAWSGRPELRAVLEGLQLAGIEDDQRAKIKAENQAVDQLATAMRQQLAAR